MHSRERKALKHLRDTGPGVMPSGVGGVAKTNLLQRGWIERAESEKDFGPDRYRITEAGLAAVRGEEEPS